MSNGSEQWDGEERRKEIRRVGDRDVCPFHKIKCDQIHKNENHIEQLFEKMATKEDIKDMRKAIEKIDESKAPRWVVGTMIVTAVPILIALVVWLGSRLDTVYVMKANQEILMKAFDIQPVNTVKEAEKKLDKIE